MDINLCKKFIIEGEPVSIEPYGEGHINDTYLLVTTKTKYIFQRINSNVFKNPQKVMENIEGVTKHLRNKIIKNNGDAERETLNIINTKDGAAFLEEGGSFYRMYVFIDDAKSYQVVEEPKHFYNAARAFGRFQKLLSDYPAETLFETIPDFHDTKKRFAALLKAIKEDKMGRLASVKAEVDFALAREKTCSLLVEKMKSGVIPVRVTHNDTKYNNIMIDDASGEGICVIDLDTVMPGSLLYDFGDSIRFGTNPVAEDEKNLDLVYCDLNLFEHFTRGFIDEMGQDITAEEVKLMPYAARLMTFECGIRFLTDYLEGDTYFKIHREGQNLDRCRTQFKLVADMEEKRFLMDQIVQDAASKLYIKQVSSLEKVMLKPQYKLNTIDSGSVFVGSEYSYQLDISSLLFTYPAEYKVSLESPIASYVSLFEVLNVPCTLPVPPTEDDDFITKDPSVIPDVLSPLKNNTISYEGYFHKAIWVSVKPDDSVSGGTYPITITLSNEEKNICETVTFNITVTDKKLPKQELIFTQWFHSDCIATYYNVPVFSEEHWKLIDSFMNMASSHGMNMILTPVFTPPLDTEVGGERPTVQLVDVKVSDGGYSFGFEKFRRWVELCKKNNIEYIEISHLFTQWGANNAPKIMAEVNGVKTKIFGWDTIASGDEYKAFLDAFLPQLVNELKALGIDKNTYFHVSDEPGFKHIESYTKARNIIMPHISDFKVFDALSKYEFYKKGLVTTPVVGITHVDEFIEKNVPDLWTYYCCSHYNKVSNRLLAMPSYRNRIIGVQLYKYDICGFLQWGYNFYYSQYSKGKINPYAVTDAGRAFPSGDSFSVYPAENGAIPSSRLKVFADALDDIRAFKLLESLTSKQYVVSLIEDMADMEITFFDYPRNPEFLINLREKINSEILQKTIEK